MYAAEEAWLQPLHEAASTVRCRKTRTDMVPRIAAPSSCGRVAAIPGLEDESGSKLEEAD